MKMMMNAFRYVNIFAFICWFPVHKKKSILEIQVASKIIGGGIWGGGGGGGGGGGYWLPVDFFSFQY